MALAFTYMEIQYSVMTNTHVVRRGNLARREHSNALEQKALARQGCLILAISYL